MVIKMKQQFVFSLTKRKMLIESMKFYRKDLMGMNKKLFDIPFRKIQSPLYIIELDGMEMILAERALITYAQMLSAAGFVSETEKYMQFASCMNSARRSFQARYGPKVENGILRRA